MSKAKITHSTKELKSLFWVDANPLTFSDSDFLFIYLFWQFLESFWLGLSGLSGLSGSAGHGSDLALRVSKQGDYFKAPG